MILRRCRQDRVALAAKTPVAFSLREQHAHFRLAAGGQQGQSIEGAGQSAPVDEFAAALAKPAGQLQAKIFERAHISQALMRCAFRGGKEQDGQRTKLADEVLLCAPEFDRPERRRTLKNLGLCVGESLNFCAGAIDLDMQIGRSAIGVSKLENVLPSPAVGTPANGVGRGNLGGFGNRQRKGSKGPLDFDPF